ncbi:MAG: 5'-3' exonuclease [Opitutales bacterium]
MAKYLLIDGYNLAFRAYYGMPDLTTSDGFPTGILHGWVRTLWMIEDMEGPAEFGAYFDSGAAEREALDADYKANREAAPEDLDKQMPLVKGITAAMGIPVIEKEGLEADDLLAASAIHLAEAGHEAVMVSADKDLGQVVRPGITQLLPPPTANPKVGWRRLDAGGVEQKFGIPPARIPDYLALVGDTSDNVPGLKGVGPKTAVTWLTEYGDLEGIIAKANYVKPPRFQQPLADYAERLRLNLKIVTLDTDQEPVVFEDYSPDVDKLVALLESVEMKTAARDARKRYGTA